MTTRRPRSQRSRRRGARGTALRAGAVLALLLAPAAAGCGPTPEDIYPGELPERVDFNFHVKPILSDRCFACHGPDAGARKAGLRLDLEEGASTVVHPGSLWRSRLFQRIAADDPEEVMPPRDSHLKLSAYEIALIGRWIEQGAEWKRHWSFLAPERPAAPAVRTKGWARNPVDRFVLSRLEREGLRPSPEADRERLIRRVTYDLTGLPPTLREVDDFLRDRSPGAYEKVVDRLLASPAYGERMAAEWLDLARYADSHGYQDDGVRHMWRWREWVIGSFNRNQRYDEFVTWQLAGDLLPNATREQILATGFNRNHPQTAEGGVVDEEFRVEYVADRTNTFGRAFLGLTVECARCHDHKYDPIAQKDYYRLFAFFNNINEQGLVAIDGNVGPTLLLPDTGQEAKLAAARRRLAERELALQRYVSYTAQLERDGRLPRLLDVRPSLAHGLVGHVPLDEISDEEFANLARPLARAKAGDETGTAPGRIGQALELKGPTDITQIEGDPYAFDRYDPFSLSVWVYPTQHHEYAPILINAEAFVNSHRGYELSVRDGRVMAALTHIRPAEELRSVTRASLPLNRWTHLALTYDGSSRAAGLRIYLDGRLAPVTVENDLLRRTIRVKKVPFQIGGQRRVDVRTFEGGRVDEVRVYDRVLTAVEVGELAGLKSIQKLAASPRDSALRADLLAYHLIARDPEYARLFAAVRKGRAEETELLAEVEDVMVMQERPLQRATHLLSRGAYDAPGERVTPGTPAVLGALPRDLPPNRLGLARWLFSPQNPLTARVTVNRYWQMIFGNGLVRTSDDLGNQGEIPTHPELLDWLAVSFRDSGWDVKALIRTLVTSATYRQASGLTPELRERDPENRLLARGPSHRLPTEMIRDGALAASGLLVHRVGGPSVKPYQPDGLWEEKSAGRGSLAKYVQDHGEGLYRRSLYTFWKRTSPPPTAITFDATERNVCTVRRLPTNTPLQALVLLNDPQFVESARILAERMVKEGGRTPDERIAFGFRAVTARRPGSREIAILRSLHQRELARFREDRARAASLLRVGERARDPGLDAAETAAYTVVANTLLNLDEAVTKR